MKDYLSRSLATRSVSRRKFLRNSAAAAIGFSIVPRHVLGGVGYVPPSDKVNIAFIGVGSQGLRVMLHFLKEPDVQGVAGWAPNKSTPAPPQQGTHRFFQSAGNLLAGDAGGGSLSPQSPLPTAQSFRVIKR